MRLLSLVAIAALFVSGMSRAAQEDTVKPAAPQQPAAAGQAQGQSEKVGALTETSGKIVGLFNVQLVDLADPHVLVKIKTDQGETDIVDLGTAAELKSNGIEPHDGQQLFVSGRVGRINDKELLVAENLSESKLVTITRTTPLREESVKHAAARNDGTAVSSGKDAAKDGKTESADAGLQVRTVEGSVIHVRNIKIEGEAEEHVLAKLQTEDGIVVVDLGSPTTLPKVDLTAGQWVAATGFVGHLNSKPIILADSVGNLSSIKRPAAKAAPEAAKAPLPAK